MPSPSLLLMLLLIAGCSAPRVQDNLPNDGAIGILGIAQDGGRPQLGCEQACCRDLSEQEAAAVAALAVQGEQGWVLLDATPDITRQVRAVGSLPQAIVLTHAHIGHYLGLAQLGREAMGAEQLPVWCSARMAAFLRDNGPWSQLVTLGNIELHVFHGDTPFTPAEGILITPLAVPHRDEYSDTYGFSIQTEGLRALYIPDIDSWEAWGRLPEMAGAHDFALLDATFFDDHELPGRDMSLIPHPRVPHTMDLLQPLVDTGLQVYFLHLNHSNPLWDASSTAANRVRNRGFHIAAEGQWLHGHLKPQGSDSR